MKIQNYNKSIYGKKGQALVELAVFGSLILLLLGVLITYGMRYDFQQKANMHTFRKTLELANRNVDGMPVGSASYTLIKDRHIPDPSSPFGVGQVTPVMASASVTRDNKLDYTADDYAGLPKMVVHFQGNVNGQLQDVQRELAIAGIRRESFNIPGDKGGYENKKAKYSLIYGSIGGWCPYQNDDEFDDNCAGETINIRILDSSEGEVVDYNNAVRQARLIVDRDYFRQECERGKRPGSETDCNAISNYDLDANPWYVEGYYQQDGRYIFPAIENLFVLPNTNRHVETMGVQPDYTQQVNTNMSMAKSEDGSRIATTDNIYWNTVTTRTIFLNNHLNQISGEAETQSNLQTENYSTTRSEDKTIIWQTPWSR